jgi:hypothetical protein
MELQKDVTLVNSKDYSKGEWKDVQEEEVNFADEEAVE